MILLMELIFRLPCRSMTILNENNDTMDASGEAEEEKDSGNVQEYLQKCSYTILPVLIEIKRVFMALSFLKLRKFLTFR